VEPFACGSMAIALVPVAPMLLQYALLLSDQAPFAAPLA
jgi:hypothetical protein